MNFIELFSIIFVSIVVIFGSFFVMKNLKEYNQELKEMEKQEMEKISMKKLPRY